MILWRSLGPMASIFDCSWCKSDKHVTVLKDTEELNPWSLSSWDVLLQQKASAEVMEPVVTNRKKIWIAK